MPFKSIHLNQTGIKGPPPAWSELKFNPVRLYSLCHHLGLIPQEPGIFQRYQQLFLAADLVWFAAGLSEDNHHGLNRDTFHAAFQVFRENTPAGKRGNTLWSNLCQDIRQLIFDLATMLDRVYGGSTMMLYVEGAMVPGAPVLPEYLKADIYLLCQYLYATTKIAKLEAQLQQASEKEEDLKLEIANLHDELMAAFATLHTQGAMLAAHDNHHSMSTLSKPTSPTPSHTLPFPLLPINLASSGKAHTLPAAPLSPSKFLSFPKIEPLKCPQARDFPGPSGASLNSLPTSPSVG
ncbi:hypothetical protein L208DRAFT_1517100 [Tricholoma matsutake]|nr:hypothetical protein L208DRAFT_1517100 [Tricholoma matsutake 945]